MTDNTPPAALDRSDTYECCGELFWSQIQYEQHLMSTHGHLRDTLPAILKCQE